MNPHAFPEAWRRGVYEAIVGRRDMRHFRPDPVSPETLARVLSAAHHAGPTGFAQPWNFMVVDDPHVREKVHARIDAERVNAAEASKGERRDADLEIPLDAILDAPLNICITCDPTRFGPASAACNTMPETVARSSYSAIQNLELAARAEGVGVGWVNIVQPTILRDVLGIPESVLPVAYLCMGFVEDFSAQATADARLPLEELVFQNTWGNEPDAPLHAALKAMRNPAELATYQPHTKGDGQVIVYTGLGKGKTTAALGLAWRALGRGLPVAVVQFIKGKWKTGERLFAERLDNLTFLVMGQGFTWDADDLTRPRKAAREAWDRAAGLIVGGEQSVVVLDEIVYAIGYGFISLEEVMEVLRERPSHVHVVLTGRHAPPELCEMADLVTDMQVVKHPYQRGIKAQIGIDF